LRCVLHHFSNRTRLEGSWGPVGPENGRKPTKNLNLDYSFLLRPLVKNGDHLRIRVARERIRPNKISTVYGSDLAWSVPRPVQRAGGLWPCFWASLVHAHKQDSSFWPCFGAFLVHSCRALAVLLGLFGSVLQARQPTISGFMLVFVLLCTCPVSRGPCVYAFLVNVFLSLRKAWVFPGPSSRARFLRKSISKCVWCIVQFGFLTCRVRSHKLSLSDCGGAGLRYILDFRVAAVATVALTSAGARPRRVSCGHASRRLYETGASCMGSCLSPRAR
jgi:hypothetical protein